MIAPSLAKGGIPLSLTPLARHHHARLGDCGPDIVFGISPPSGLHGLAGVTHVTKRRRIEAKWSPEWAVTTDPQRLRPIEGGQCPGRVMGAHGLLRLHQIGPRQTIWVQNAGGHAAADAQQHRRTASPGHA